MLNRCFIRPSTVDRIRASWIADAIGTLERYVVAQRADLRRSETFCFDSESLQKGLAQGHGKKLPSHVESFVESSLRL